MRHSEKLIFSKLPTRRRRSDVQATRANLESKMGFKNVAKNRKNSGVQNIERHDKTAIIYMTPGSRLRASRRGERKAGNYISQAQKIGQKLGDKSRLRALGQASDLRYYILTY